MRSAIVILTSFALATGVIAQHGHVDIPEIDRYVHSMLDKYNKYTKYPGPSPTYWQHPSPRPTKPVPKPPVDKCSFWMENIKHQGVAAFNPSPSTYQVFRNVKDFGAQGDGVTDDTAAINNAISSGGRCGPQTCGPGTTTTSPAVVYFPSGTYMVNASIIDYYYTQIIGNPNCLPIIRAFATFTGGLGVIDGDQYGAHGLGWGSTNKFWTQIRNFVIDMTLVPASSAITGIHWPTAQATSLQNIVFNMSDANGTQHQGFFIEEGSGGFMNDLTFYGGLNAITFGNQQFTVRNLTFYNAVTAINQIWDWGMTYYGISINNCSVGLNMAAGGPTAQSVGSMTFFDSSITNTPIGIITAHDATSQPLTAGSLIVENVVLNNVPIAIQGPGATTALAGTTGQTTITGWGEGHSYTPNGPVNFEGPIVPNNRPANLLAGNRYYARSKPQYQNYPVSSFVSARTSGATGNGHTDDTAALQRAIYAARAQNKVLYVDHGDYLVTSTIYVPSGSKIVGESYSVILSSGSFFNSVNKPQLLFRLARTGNLAASSGVIYLFLHEANNEARYSSINVTSANLNQNCIAAFMHFHVTKQSSGLYLENVWLWTADHDVEDPALRQITVYTGRGMLVESSGPVWLVGTAVEHNVLYEYQFVKASNIFGGQMQIETAYYQPNPPAPIPFPYVASLNDPQFPVATITADGYVIPASEGWGLRIVDSSNLLFYGVGLYSFFNNYSTACSNQGAGETCQNHIFSLEGRNSAISLYNLNTVGTHYQITIDGKEVAYYADNANGFISTRSSRDEKRRDDELRGLLIDHITNAWQLEKPAHNGDEDGELGCCDLENETSVPNVLRSSRGRRMILYALLFVVALIYAWRLLIRPDLIEDYELVEGFRLRQNGTYGVAKGGHWKHGGAKIQFLPKRLLPGGEGDAYGKRRLVFVGDTHGCRKELLSLLEAVHFDAANDHLIATGDVISKGPDSAGVLEELIRLHATSVRGNHEDRILASAKSSDIASDDDAVNVSRSKKAKEDRKLIKHFKKRHFAYLERMPLILRIPALPLALRPSAKKDSPLAEEMLVVHAGLVPDVPVEKQDPYFVMNMRSLTGKSHTPSSEHATGKKRKGERFRPWIDIWNWYAEHLFKGKSLSGNTADDGPDNPDKEWLQNTKTGVESIMSAVTGRMQHEHSPKPQIVVYGHDSKVGLSLKRWTKGLDSGCVSGGHLTAMVLDAKGRTEIVSVKCGEYW
nr:hypothetical protein B0A51_12479 [Rachicladosporium sp. CCFEE 5018]